MNRSVNAITRPKRGFTAETQFPNITKRNRKQQLVIGLDFGTAFTKVVVGETRQALGVHFSSFGTDDNPYLLPAAIVVNVDGVCSIDLKLKDAKKIESLKMGLLRGNVDDELRAQIVAYLALVLQYTRKWVFDKHKDTYKNSYIDWNLNVGLPSHNYHNDRLVESYRKIAYAAWVLSVTSTEVTLDLAQSVLKAELNVDAMEDKVIHRAKIRLFPEFVAQITGYVRSPQRQRGLHALMDVGAGTVDVTLFNVHQRDGENYFPIFAKSVENMGALFMAKNRLESANYNGRWLLGAQESMPADKEFARKIRVNMAQLKEIDRPFRKKVLNQLTSELRYTRQHRDPLSRHWYSGLPIFLCGGGANIQLYAGIVQIMQEQGKPFKLLRQYLPKPDRLKASWLGTDKFDRLSVAYGLSFDALDIGEIERADKTEDFNRSDAKLETPENYGECPVCSGTGGFHGCYKCGGSGWLK